MHAQGREANDAYAHAKDAHAIFQSMKTRKFKKKINDSGFLSSVNLNTF